MLLAPGCCRHQAPPHCPSRQGSVCRKGKPRQGKPWLHPSAHLGWMDGRMDGCPVWCWAHRAGISSTARCLPPWRKRGMHCATQGCVTGGGAALPAHGRVGNSMPHTQHWASQPGDHRHCGTGTRAQALWHEQHGTGCTTARALMARAPRHVCCSTSTTAWVSRHGHPWHGHCGTGSMARRHHSTAI